MAHSTADDHTNPTQQRTVLLATDNKNSVLAEVVVGRTNHIAYSAYGHQSAKQDVTTRLGFNGELREARIGWYLLGNGYRAYNPRLMRFHSPDSWSPFGGGGLNPYIYCVGDPVNRVDPTGHVPWIEPSVTRFFKNAFNFLFGGSEITGSSRSRAISATQGTGMVMSPVGKGEGRALGTVGAVIAVAAPTKRTRGLYLPKGDGSTHGMKWGRDTHFAEYQVSGKSTAVSGQQSPTAQTSNMNRASIWSEKVLYDGPTPPEPRIEHMQLLGTDPSLRRNYWPTTVVPQIAVPPLPAQQTAIRNTPVQRGEPLRRTNAVNRR